MQGFLVSSLQNTVQPLLGDSVIKPQNVTHKAMHIGGPKNTKRGTKTLRLD